MPEESNDNKNINGNTDNNKQEKRKRKFTRIKTSTSIYIIKGLVFLGLATIAIITSQTINALLLGALTYAAGIIFDMCILSNDNSKSVILWISVFQWVMTIIIIGLTIIVFVLLVTYDALIENYPLIEKELSLLINFWVPVFMYGIAIVNLVTEVYYSLPYDD